MVVVRIKAERECVKGKRLVEDGGSTRVGQGISRTVLSWSPEKAWKDWEGIRVRHQKFVRGKDVDDCLARWNKVGKGRLGKELR